MSGLPGLAGRFVCLSLCTLLWLGPSSLARADALRAHLTWSHPIGSMCPSRAMLERDVEELSGQEVFVERGEAQVLVEGGVEELPESARARLTARDASGAVLGTRELVAPARECASLRAALGVVLTMLLDQEVALAPATRSRRALSGGPFLALRSGLLPRLAPGLGLDLALELRPGLRMRADLSYLFPVSSETTTGVGARFQALTVGLGACPALARRWLWLCTGAQLSSLYATPRGLNGPGQLRLLGQAVLELVASLPLSRSSRLSAGLGLVVSPSRPEFFYVRNTGSEARVLRPELFGALLRFGVSFGEP